MLESNGLLVFCLYLFVCTNFVL